jgi:hypothetical protein
MKKGIFLSLLLMFAMTLNIGCDKLDITEELTLDLTLDVVSPTADFNIGELFDADSLSSTIEQYSSKIKDIQLLEATYQITSVGDSNLATKIITSTLTVADEFGAGEEIIATITNQDIAFQPVPLPLPLNQSGIDRFEGLMTNSPHRAMLKNMGNADGAPVDFTVKFVFKVKMTANPL